MEGDCQAFVDGLPIGIVQAHQRRHAFTQRALPDQRLCSSLRVWPADADDAYAAATGRRGDGDDGVVAIQAFTFASDSTCFVTHHCWAIDSRLFTNQ